MNIISGLFVLGSYQSLSGCDGISFRPDADECGFTALSGTVQQNGQPMPVSIRQMEELPLDALRRMEVQIAAGGRAGGHYGIRLPVGRRRFRKKFGHLVHADGHIRTVNFAAFVGNYQGANIIIPLAG